MIQKDQEKDNNNQPSTINFLQTFELPSCHEPKDVTDKQKTWGRWVFGHHKKW